MQMQQMQINPYLNNNINNVNEQHIEKNIVNKDPIGKNLKDYINIYLKFKKLNIGI